MFAALPTLTLEQRWRGQAFPAPIVVALIRRLTVEGTASYLLIRRNGDAYGGQWALVGGKWDFGETLAEAIVREVKEETDLDTQFVALRGVVNERVASPEPVGKGAHFLLFVCELAGSDGRALEQEEGAVAWFTAGDIEAMHANGTIIPSDYLMIQTFAGAVQGGPMYEAEMISTLTGQESGAGELVRFESY